MLGKRNKVNRRVEPPAEGGLAARFSLHLVALTMLGAVICGMALWGWLKLEDPDTLPIAAVEIQGEFHHLTKQQIQQVLEGRIAGGFFNVDVDAVRDTLLTIPWVNTATVRRVWPDTLQITVVEQLPVARWSTGGLVNSNGQLFFPMPETYPPGLPEWQGPSDSQAAMAARYQDMQKALQPLTLHINRVVLDERRSWKVELDSGVVLVLGRANDDARLWRFTRLYPVALAARATDIEQVDLRYTNGFSVRWKTL